LLAISVLPLITAAAIPPDSPHLIRLYRLDSINPDTPVAKNLAALPDIADADFTYHGKQSLQNTGQAIRIDQGCFAAKPFAIHGKSFTIELRIRKLGQGIERGNNQDTNGTIFAMGNGWDRGLRLTTNYPQNLVFSIGRPGEEKSVNLFGKTTVPDNVWLRLAATWDGQTMRLYVDGLIYGIISYGGDYTPTPDDFRVGFNGYGVGSLRMDVAEVAVFDRSLTAAEILQHALPAEKLDATNGQLYDNIIRNLLDQKFPTANDHLDKILSSPLAPVYQTAFQVLQASLIEQNNQPAAAQRRYALLAGQIPADNYYHSFLVGKCFPLDILTPTPLACPSVYEELISQTISPMSDLPVIGRTARLALSKCLILSRFLTDHQLPNENEQKVLHEIPPLVTDKAVGLDTSYREKFAHEIITERQRLARPVSPLADFTPAKTFHVAIGGQAGNPGTATAPFATLNQARDAIRQLRPLPKGGVEVIISGGVYQVDQSFVLEQQDSGSADAPIVYRAAKDETVTFTGGITISGFKPVTDEKIITQLPPEARGKVVYAPIPEPSKIPSIASRGNGYNGPNAASWVDLFINGRAQQIARYPNDGFMHTGKAIRAFVETPTQGDPGIFEFKDDRVLRWQNAPDGWLFGYWGHLWAATSCKIGGIDAIKHQITLATPNPYGHRDNMPYYAFNLLEELDSPGEWYLDRTVELLYVYPPGQLDLNQAEVRLSSFPAPFVMTNNTSHITFAGLNFAEGSGTAISVNGGENMLFAGCTIRRFGNWAMALSGKKHRVISCDLQILGGGGIDLNGGEIKTLTASHNTVENCIISDFSRVDRAYTPAVLLNGVGNRIAHNLIYDSPHHAIRVEGMEHLVEYNEVHDVVRESDDQAGLDAWGNPFMRGLVVRFNYWHDIGNGRDIAGQGGIRLDDMISAVLIYGNVFRHASSGGFGGIQIHGGKDSIADNNLFFDCQYAVSFSPWEPDRWREMLSKPGEFGRRQRASGYTPETEPFKSKYPDYAELNTHTNRNFIVNNLAIGADSFTRNEHNYNYLANNFSLPPEASALAPLSPDSSLYQFTGLRPIPFDLIGLYRDTFRKTLPARTEPNP
jgi:hypothetical protein